MNVSKMNALKHGCRSAEFIAQERQMNQQFREATQAFHKAIEAMAVVL